MTFEDKNRNKELVHSVWRSESAYKRFSSAIRRKFKADLLNLPWQGKEAGEPHPLFEKWLINGKL